MNFMVNNNIANNDNYLNKSKESEDIDVQNDKIIIDSSKTINSKNDKKEYSDDEINKIIDEANDKLKKQKIKTHVELAMHDVLHTTMIKVINDKTDEVIREYPPEKILDAVAKMCEDAGILVDKKV